jgi:hypothetical protein
MKKVRKSAAPKISVKETGNELDSLREFVSEAEVVDLITKQPGWIILERDLNEYRDQISAKLAYLDPKSKEFTDARILFIASDKLFSLIEDYAENRKRALELLEKIDNTGEHIVLDVDN